MKRPSGQSSIISISDRCTAFEEKVYAAVSRIPRGEVKSYAWVAERIGIPGAARAVGNALNKNPLPGIIPCHRVIRSNGTIGGFSRGVRRKRAMLKKEGVDLVGQKKHTFLKGRFL